MRDEDVCRACNGTGGSHEVHLRCVSCEGTGFVTTPPTPPRPEPVATADLARTLRQIADDCAGHWAPSADECALIHRAAKALEDTAAERDRAHATLEQIVSEAENHADAVYLARNLLPGLDTKANT